MDQDLLQWIDQHRQEIQDRWWQAVRDTDHIPTDALTRWAQKPSDDLRTRLLDALVAEAAPDPDWLADLTQHLTPSGWQALLSALRRSLHETLAADTPPALLLARWQALDGALDRLGLHVAQALDAHQAAIDAERTHWQTLYKLTQELEGIDLNYVLQKALTRILDNLQARRGAILLLDPDTQQLLPRAAKNWSGTDLHFTDMPDEWQRGHGNAYTFSAHAPANNALDRLINDPDETLVAAPLLAHGQFHGLLAIATSQPEHLGDDLIQAVARNVAAHVGNTQVIQTLSEQSRELGLMLRQQQEESSKRQAILASIADGVVVNDPEGHIILVNRAAEIILDTPARELLGGELTAVFERFETGGRQDIYKTMAAILKNPYAQFAPEATQTILEVDTRTISARLAPVVTERGEFLGVVTILRDITKEIEADRAKSEFVSTVSHELRTPMTAIKGFTDLIYSGAVGEINENQKRFLGIIKNNTDRLTALINDLLDISRVETGRVRFEPQPVRIGELVRNVVDALAPNAESKDHRLSCHIEAGLPEIMGDPNRLNQIFTNLIANAINYTPNGGEIEVSVYTVQGAIRADVRDNGIGIQPEDLGRIFERFYRADHPVVQESRGTGLGLPIVKMFVEMHGGRVWAESEPGEGSCFTVLLPLPTAQPEEQELEELLAEVPFQPGRQILIADDDPDIAELVRVHLQKAGYSTLTVGRGADVVEMARQHTPDLIILDILLPDIDGRQVLRTLKDDPATADIPVLVLTIVADDSTIYELGAADYLTKPISEQELIDAVRLAFSRRGRVLVVEDDADTVEMMRVALRRVGYTVDVAAEGYEAMSLARRWRPDAIVLDLRLPGMDGYETLTHLKRSPATRGIPIIVTSAHVANTEQEAKRLKSLGAASFLPKPFTVGQLVSNVDRTLRQFTEADDDNHGG